MFHPLTLLSGSPALLRLLGLLAASSPLCSRDHSLGILLPAAPLLFIVLNGLLGEDGGGGESAHILTLPGALYEACGWASAGFQKPVCLSVLKSRPSFFSLSTG